MSASSSYTEGDASPENRGDKSSLDETGIDRTPMKSEAGDTVAAARNERTEVTTTTTTTAMRTEERGGEDTGGRGAPAADEATPAEGVDTPDPSPPQPHSAQLLQRLAYLQAVQEIARADVDRCVQQYGLNAVLNQHPLSHGLKGKDNTPRYMRGTTSSRTRRTGTGIAGSPGNRDTPRRTTYSSTVNVVRRQQQQQLPPQRQQQPQQQQQPRAPSAQNAVLELMLKEQRETTNLLKKMVETKVSPPTPPPPPQQQQHHQQQEQQQQQQWQHEQLPSPESPEGIRAVLLSKIQVLRQLAEAEKAKEEAQEAADMQRSRAECVETQTQTQTQTPPQGHRHHRKVSVSRRRPSFLPRRAGKAKHHVSTASTAGVSSPVLEAVEAVLRGNSPDVHTPSPSPLPPGHKVECDASGRLLLPVETLPPEVENVLREHKAFATASTSPLRSGTTDVSVWTGRDEVSPAVVRGSPKEYTCVSTSPLVDPHYLRPQQVQLQVHRGSKEDEPETTSASATNTTNSSTSTSTSSSYYSSSVSETKVVNTSSFRTSAAYNSHIDAVLQRVRELDESAGRMWQEASRELQMALGAPKQKQLQQTSQTQPLPPPPPPPPPPETDTDPQHLSVHFLTPPRPRGSAGMPAIFIAPPVMTTEGRGEDVGEETGDETAAAEPEAAEVAVQPFVETVGRYRKQYLLWRRANNVTPQTHAFVDRVTSSILDAALQKSGEELRAVVDNLFDGIVNRELGP